MRNRKITTVGLVLVLSLASMSFKCNSNTEPNSNTTNPLRSAARAADAIAKSISEMNTVKRDLAHQGKITAAEELKLTQQLLRLNTADKTLVNRLKSMNSTPDAAGQTQLLSMFNELTAALDDLNSTGVLSVGNEDARNRLTVIITAIRSSLVIIQSFASSHG
ncbi:MAG: hypothetical protein QOE46_2443 [Acidobacteriota bacterium]|jgi:septal ring factor EnvC (AmiA/AmiB activator)|nr:hypothetical protein [Acidobacteriota bacterium]